MRWIFLTLLLINGVVFLWPAPNPGSKLPPPTVPVQQEGVERLSLLDELERQVLTKKLQGKERLRLEGVDAAAHEPLCTLVGPFEKLLRAEYFIENMAALDILVEVQEVEIPGEIGYWVYLPPEVSRKEALRRLHELQAKGVDSYVIPKGELANGISFGMFSQKSLAVKRHQKMVDQGYIAEVKEVTRSYKEIWALLLPDQAVKISEELWFKVVSDNPNVERRQNFCPTVASADNFH